VLIVLTVGLGLYGWRYGHCHYVTRFVICLPSESISPGMFASSTRDGRNEAEINCRRGAQLGSEMQVARNGRLRAEIRDVCPDRRNFPRTCEADPAPPRPRDRVSFQRLTSPGL